MEKNQVDINLSTDIKTDNLVPLNITLMSRDINNNSFLLKFKSDGADVQLNNSFTVEILSVFPNSKIEILTQAVVYGNTAMWEFDTKYITRNEVVSNYVYVKKDGVPIISADANAFTFSVGLSKIDGNAGKTAETYDRNYEKVLHEFEVAINLTKDEWAQMADATRDFVDEIKDKTVDEFVELKMGEELQNLESEYATRLTGLETNDASITAQLAQKATKGEIAVFDIDKNKGKFDQTYMTDEFLQQMLGNTPINTVPANASLTTAKYANKSVAEKKVSFLTSGKNNFNKDSEFIDGGYYEPVTGQWLVSTNFRTYLINVEPGKSYASNVPSSHIVYFDANMVFISGQKIGEWTTMDTPANSNVYFAAVAVTKTADISKYMIVEGELPLEYVPYRFKLSDSIELSDRTKEMLITADDLKFSTLTKNRFDKAKVQIGYEVYNDGGIRTQADSAVTGYVYVEGLDAIYVSGLPVYATGYTPRNGFFYDANNNHIGEQVVLASSTTEKGFVVPVGASYFVLTIYQRKTSAEVIDFGTIQIEKGNSKTPYEPYEVGITEIKGNKIGVADGGAKTEIVNPLSGLKWNALGDSITFGSGVTIPYHQAIANRTGILPRNYGVSGSNITVIAGRTDSFVERYVDMQNDADIITVFGGTNDAGNSVPIGVWGDTINTTLYGAMTILIEGLLTKYPSKRIGFILPLPRTAYVGLENGLVTRIKVMDEVCQHYSIPTLDLYKGSGIAPHYLPSKNANMPDGLHPNDAGHRVISHKIEEFLKRI